MDYFDFRYNDHGDQAVEHVARECGLFAFFTTAGVTFEDRHENTVGFVERDTDGRFEGADVLDAIGY